MADYQLIRGGLTLAMITRTGADWPWEAGTAVFTPDFEAVRRLFEEENALLEADQVVDWGKIWDEIAKPGLILRPTDGKPDITEFLIHFDGCEARWRY